MFCPHCGVPLSDDGIYCPSCGKRAPGSPQPIHSAPASPASAVPVATVAPPPQPMPSAASAAPSKPLGRNKYIFTLAGVKAKLLSVFTLLLAVVCVVLMIRSHFKALDTSVEDFPVISLALSAFGVEDLQIDMVKAELLNAVDEVREAIDEYEDELILSDEYGNELAIVDVEELKKVPDILADCAENLSFNNISRLIESAGKLVDVEIDGIPIFPDALTVLTGEIDVIFRGIAITLLCVMLAAALLTACGGIFQLRVLVIFGLLLSTLYTVILCGLLVTLLLFALHVTMVVLISLVKSEYKQYRKAVLAGR